MKKTIVAGVILVSVVLALLSVHIVHLDDGLKFLMKTEMTLNDTYVDARGMKKIELLTKPALIEAGIKDILD